MRLTGTQFINTQNFSPAAKHFEKYGYYTDALSGTREWSEYWNEQKRRCLEGYSIGGMKITGYHYFYLNFSVIDKVPTNEKTTNADKVRSFPDFWDGDYNYFWTIEIARRGMSKKDYDDLGLAVDIYDLNGGNHVVVLKSRGVGYSFKGGSMLARNFLLKRGSKSYAMADDKEYLIKDGVLDKAYDIMDFNDDNCAWAQPRIKNSELYKRSGYKQKVGGREIVKGTNNKLIGVTLKNDPDKARGKRGELIFFEEAGKCPGLLKSWEVCRPSVEQGAITTGQMIAYGTGGTDDAQYEGLEELFYHPEVHNVIPLYNQWDEGMDGSLCSFFHPAYVNWQGFIDDDGNSDVDGAKEYLQGERELKKKSRDNSALEQTVSEKPFTPKEATLQTSNNMFPSKALSEQKNSITANHRHKSMAVGRLYRDADNDVKFKPSPDSNPVFNYPIRKGDDTTGSIVVKEAPYRMSDGKIPNNLYIVCHDPYAKDGQATSSSLGAAYVLKITNNFDRSLNDCIVASYVGRPDRQDDYNDNLFKLAEYYNAKIAFENNRGNVVEYAKRHRKLQYLFEDIEVTDKKDRMKRSTTSVTYGMTVNQREKQQGEIYIRDWLKLPINKTEDKVIMVLHTILDPALLTELIKYSKDGNFDRVSALIIGMYYMKELTYKGKAPQDNTEKQDDFFDKELFA